MNWQSWELWDWPFLDTRHHELADRVVRWIARRAHEQSDDLNRRSRAIARDLGADGLLDFVIPSEFRSFDVRCLCVVREALTYDDALNDAIFTMQGIGTLAIQEFGTQRQKAKYLPGCRVGSHIAAFALTEPEAGSDVASMSTEARREGDWYFIDGAKTLISNAQFADHFIVVARTGEAPGSRGLSAFVVDAGTPGLLVSSPIDFIAEHPAAALQFSGCRVPADALIGQPGHGFKVALGAFDIFRPSVGAAAVGLARRAMGEALSRIGARRLFGKPMADMQSVQMTLADMAADIDTSALAVYRAAWERDVRRVESPYAPSLAKLVAAEAAGRVVDKAVQLCGGAGVTRGNLVEKLYREARPMRIYEGASEVQKLIMGRSILKSLALPS